MLINFVLTTIRAGGNVKKILTKRHSLHNGTSKVFNNDFWLW